MAKPDEPKHLRLDVPSMARLFRSEKYPTGISSAYAMGEQAGILSPDVYSRIWNPRITRLGLITMERICEGFNCGPGDWIITRPDLMPAEGKALRRARTAMGLTHAAFAAEFSERVGFQFDAEAVREWEAGRAKVRDGIWQAIALALVDRGRR